MIDAGTHRAKARQWALGEAKTGTEQIGVLFDLLDLPGQSITWFGYFTDKALPQTVKALRACGWAGVDVSDLTGVDTNEVNLVVEHEQDQKSGQMRARVRWVNSTGGLAMENQMPVDKAKAFAARMKGQIVAAAGMPPAPRPATRTTAPTRNGGDVHDGGPPPGSDDDIPF